MSTDKDGTQAWYKHGPVYDGDANCDVWGIADVPYQRGEEQTMLMWVYSEADADRIIADHRKAAQADALAEALKVLHKCSRCRGDGSPQCVTCDDYQSCQCTPGYGRYAEKCWACKGIGISSEMARAALDSYASNPAEAGA